MTRRELLRLLKANGWELDRVQGSATISVPVHGSRDVPKGTLHAILKEAGIR